MTTQLPRFQVNADPRQKVRRAGSKPAPPPFAVTDTHTGQVVARHATAFAAVQDSLARNRAATS